MKIANKLVVLLLIVSCFCCKRYKSDIDKNQNTSIVDYQADSVYYKIDVVGDGGKELFLITNNYVVGDSVIGGFSNYDNHQKGYELIKSNPKYKGTALTIVSKVFFNENKNFSQIASIYNSDYEFHYPILKQGYFYKSVIVDGEKFGSGFLRIQEVSDYYLGGRYVNMIYYKNKWRIYSKEIDNPTKALIPYPKGYCVDTVTVNYNLSKNGFNEIFYVGDTFKCD